MDLQRVGEIMREMLHSLQREIYDKTVSAYSSRNDSREASEDLAKQIIAGGLLEPHALIVFASSQYNYSSVLAGLEANFSKSVLVGCSSAGEFSTNGIGDGNLSALAIQSDEMMFSASMAENISARPEEAARDLLNDFRGFSEGRYRYRTALILNDALAGSADELVHALNRQTGGKYKFFGGGAGDDAAFTRTHVFYGREVASNAVVALEILSTKPIGVGVRHGWEPATEPMRVTSAVGAKVDSLNATIASEVFEQYAEETGQKLDVKAPLSFFLHNIVGIRLEEGYKLRVPLGIEEEGTVNFAAEIPEGSAVSIMAASTASSVTAAKEATEDAVRQLAGNRPAGALMFDCVATRLASERPSDRKWMRSSVL